MNLLKEESNSTNQAIDDFDRYLMSLKNDSESAFRSVSAYYSKMKDDEYILRLIALDSSYSKYSPKIERCYSLLDAIYDRLQSLPIDVRKVNELENELSSLGEEVSDSIKKDYEQMLLTNASILYANRDRRHLGEVDVALKQAESYYFSSEFKKAYDEINATLKRVAGE